MERIEIEVKPRDLGEKETKRNVNQLRREGWIPGILYGHGEPVSIAVDNKVFSKALHNKAGANALFTVKLGAEAALSVVKQIQRHIFTHKPSHVDFMRINVKEKLEIKVPIHAVGEAPGVKNQGGILEMITREARVKCLPDDIPVSIDVDVSKLEMGHSIKVKDLPAIKGVEILTLPDTILVNIVAPKVEEAPAVAVPGAEGAGQPEVIAKGKEKEEGAAAPAAGAAKGAAPAKAAAPAKEEKKK
ncbi:MAG: 50S ribosomal protein L25 [Elusimicrobiota bacterium]